MVVLNPQLRLYVVPPSLFLLVCVCVCVVIQKEGNEPNNRSSKFVLSLSYI